MLSYQNSLDITQDMSQNAKIAFNFLPDFSTCKLNIRIDCLWRLFFKQKEVRSGIEIAVFSFLWPV